MIGLIMMLALTPTTLPADFFGLWRSGDTSLAVGPQTMVVTQSDNEKFMALTLLSEFGGEYVARVLSMKGMKVKVWRDGASLKTQLQIPGWKPGLPAAPVVTYRRTPKPKKDAPWAVRAEWELNKLFMDDKSRIEQAHVVSNFLVGAPDDFYNWVIRRRKQRIRASFFVKGAPGVVWEFNRQGHIKSEFIRHDGNHPKLDKWLRSNLLPTLVDALGE